jgi:hypothetical protein
MHTKIPFLLGALFLFSLGCDPKKDPVPPQDQDFSCIQLFDEVGQTMGIHGSCTSSNDWKNITLSADEQAFLNFSDTISLNGTVSTPVSFIGIAPNPVKIGQALHFYAVTGIPTPHLKVKVAIVDESLNIIQQYAVRYQSGLALYMDPAKFQSGKYYRMYYRVSATGSASLIEGYGNFLVCQTFIDGVNTTIESDCL